ncbi:MAG TPA: M28 family metallopeptidase [Blastocatellia bacterium]|jgi:Zn-dependent M28 family amino/carboxypeptidase|nr:M28 family metallopeptidase [Blastocatellia bacterium]
MNRFLITACSFLSIFAVACGDVAQNRPATSEAAADPPPAALEAIKADNLMNHIKILSADDFEGRGPATRGEELTIKYLADEFKKIGLAPGNTDGTYFQKVPLVGITTSSASPLEIKAGAKTLSMKFPDDFVARTMRVVDKQGFDADMVFVGYGAVAPEYNWNDYKDVDVRGKVLVMLVGDPPVPDPSNPSDLDPKTFNGKAMTYYGRWTYKFEIAAEKGAAGILIVHETAPAGYGWEVPRGSFTIENFDLVSKDNNMSRVPIEGWITLDKTRELFAATGKDFDALKSAALSRDFKPVDLGAHARLTVENKIRRSDSNNVVAKLEGSDPKLKDQYVIYSAHWDHLGIGLPDASGDKIYNGAIDNATGTAALIEIARGFKALPKPPARSILFLAVTAEEKGLIGSKHYSENPIYPLDKTVAAINMDALNVFGRTRDVVVVGLGASELDDVLAQAAATQKRTLKPDPEPEKGFYYRSDHFNFAKQGVPALYPDGGTDFIDKPEGYGAERSDEYLKVRYHKPADQITDQWDLSGMVEDLRLFLNVGYRVANTEKYPEWKPGNEFKARREEMMKKAAAR